MWSKYTDTLNSLLYYSKIQVYTKIKESGASASKRERFENTELPQLSTYDFGMYATFRYGNASMSSFFHSFCTWNVEFDFSWFFSQKSGTVSVQILATSSVTIFALLSKFFVHVFA